eukprot:511163_1
MHNKLNNTRPTSIQIHPIHIIIKKNQYKTHIIKKNIKFFYILFKSIFSSLFYRTYHIKNSNEALICSNIKLGGIFNKIGEETYDLAFDKILVMVQLFIIICALSHSLVSAQYRIPTFLLKFIIYMSYITKNIHQIILNTN